MSTWRERARKLVNASGDSLPKLTKAPFVSSVSSQDEHIREILEPATTANPVIEVQRDTYGGKLVALVRCGDCSKFIRNHNNPQAGIGTCKDGEPDRGRWPYFPLAMRVCDAFEGASHD